MSEQPTAAPSGGGGKKILGVPRRTFFIIAGAGLVAGLAFYWYKNYKAAQNNAATSGTSSTSANGIDYSGQLSTLQAEIQALQQENAGATVGGGTSGGGGTWSGGGWGGGSGGDSSGSTSSGDSTGSATTSGGSTSTSGSDSGATSTGTPAPPVTSSSSGSTSSSSSGSTASTAAPAPTGGHGTRTGATTATVTWNGNGAKSWNLKIATPGPLNGHTGHTTVPEGVYSGLQSGHSAVVTVTPLSASGTPGPSGTIYIPSN